MKMIITGGAGFIGGNFIHYMLKKHPEYRTICLDSLTYAGDTETLAPVMGCPNFRFCKVDITDRSEVFRIFGEEHPDVVVNFAAESHVDRSIKNPGLFLRTNIIGTQTLMDACVSFGIQRFHQVSTDEAGADLLAQAYHRTFGLPVTISRCSNNYGPYQFPEKLIPLMITNALSEKPLTVYGEGLNIRDWLYVDDHCRAIDLIIQEGTIGEIYNIGGHNEMSNIDIVKMICKALGKPEDLITHVADRKGHDMRYAIDPTKIHRELGWFPETKFSDGIQKTICWYLDNRKWWERLVKQ